MSLKINIGVCKKIGLPDYGSAGSHCDIEIEMDHGTLSDPDEFQRRVRHAYGLCRQAVEEELSGHHGAKARLPVNSSSKSPSEQRERVTEPAPEHERERERERATEPDRAPQSSGNNARSLSTPRQMKFIGQLCRGVKGLDNRRLDAYCRQEFGKSSQQLSAQDASRLIDMLKDAKERGGLA